MTLSAKLSFQYLQHGHGCGTGLGLEDLLMAITAFQPFGVGLMGK